jgi:outer membrane protein assembly factor BamA
VKAPSDSSAIDDSSFRLAPCARVGFHLLLAAFITLTLVHLPSDVRAQAIQQDSPRIDQIEFRGVENASRSDLRAVIVNEETRCRALLLQPFCWVMDSPLWVRRSYLDRPEVVRDVIRLRVHYFRKGYRHAQIASRVEEDDKGVRVIFTIEEGEPTLLESVDIDQFGEGLTDRQIARARLPREDRPFDLDNLEVGIEQLVELLGDAGYLDARVRDTIDVDREQRIARLAVTIEPGPRSYVRDVEISGNDDVDDSTIRDALRLRPNRVLRTRNIAAAQQGLYESNLFHEARVVVPPQPDSMKLVEVEVREAPPQFVRVGTGFNTVDFLQVEGRYTHYNFMGGGRRLDLRGTVGNLLAPQLNDWFVFGDVLPPDDVGIGIDETQPFTRPTYSVTAEFRQPAFRSAENVVGVGAFMNRRIVPGVVVDEGFGGDVTATRRVAFRTPLSFSYTYEVTSVYAGDLYFCVNYGVCDLETISAVRGRHSLSPASFTLISDRADDPLGPRTGYRLRASAEHASQWTMSDYRYHRLAADGAYYYPFDLYRNRVGAARLRVGWVRPLESTGGAVGIDLSEEQALLHPRKRFYAGGSRSVRGYGENQLGPRILTVDPEDLLNVEGGCSSAEISAGTCDPGVAPMDAFLPRPLGGTAVIEGSVEYRVGLFGSFVGAAFIDAAVVGEGVGGLFSQGSFAVTPGFGMRFVTPVGPIRLDLGIRPSVTERLPVVTEYEDEDGFRQLVQLDQNRRYNPVEAAGGGFLREILARLSLHLSIGEAF